MFCWSSPVNLSLSLSEGQCCDEGKSFLAEVPDSPAAKAYAEIIDGVCVCVCVCVITITLLFQFFAAIVRRCEGVVRVKKEEIQR